MSLTGEDALFACVIAAFGAAVLIAKRFSRPPMALTQWAEEHSFTIVRATYREYAHGPFEKIGIRHQQDVYQITIRTTDGTARGAWVRCNYKRGMERVEVVWDTPQKEPSARRSTAQTAERQNREQGCTMQGDDSLLNVLTKAGMIRELLPSKDALVTFIAAGEKPAPEVAAQMHLHADVRWHAVPGGCLVKTPHCSGAFPPGPFRMEAGGLGYGRCDCCTANVDADEESWVTAGDPFHRLCDECHGKLREA